MISKKELYDIIKYFIPTTIKENRKQWRKKLLEKKQEKKKRIRENQERSVWYKLGCPDPPPHIVKQKTIKEYQKESGYQVLIETGTYLGEMVESQKRHFRQIISIELSEKLFRKAEQRFRNDHKVNIYQGDSGKVLPEVLKYINEPVIFWLDGHYSEGITAKGDKDCPIWEELEGICQKNLTEFIILIDDARCFVGEGDYPEVRELRQFFQNQDINFKWEVKNDIIRVSVKQ